MDGTRLPWRATLGQCREMARRATTRGLAQILDLAPVAGSLWDMRNGGSYDYYDLVYLGSPTRPRTASLRLALVFASDPPEVPTAPAPPHDRSQRLKEYWRVSRIPLSPWSTLRLHDECDCRARYGRRRGCYCDWDNPRIRQANKAARKVLGNSIAMYDPYPSVPLGRND